RPDLGRSQALRREDELVAALIPGSVEPGTDGAALQALLQPFYGAVGNADFVQKSARVRHLKRAGDAASVRRPGRPARRPRWRADLSLIARGYIHDDESAGNVGYPARRIGSADKSDLVTLRRPRRMGMIAAGGRDLTRLAPLCRNGPDAAEQREADL